MADDKASEKWWKSFDPKKHFESTPWYYRPDAKPKIETEQWFKELQWTPIEGTAKTPKGTFSYEVIANSNSGWKLHLNFDRNDENKVDTIASHLLTLREKGLISHFKFGLSSEQSGKEATVYIGHRDQTQYVADALEKAIGGKLNLPEGETLKDDIVFSDHLMGRFEVLNVDSEFHQYGAKGHSLLNTDVQNLLYRDWKDPKTQKMYEEAVLRAKNLLATRYKDFFTGRNAGAS